MKMSIRALLTLFTALVAFSQAAFAVVYPLPPKDSRLVGENIQITVPED
ncbi:L,D-transpeptidase, partial [Enterobacteriaceae bacterium 8376wG6]|nr:L,D-transpeptidase [Enterobacteriaceae bacterium 8376wG6]